MALVGLSIVRGAENPLLWYATTDSIKTTEIGSYLSNTHIQAEWIEDFCLHGDYVFWIEKSYRRDENALNEARPHKIMCAKQDGTDIKTVIASDSVAQPTSIAIDPLTGEIYYADGGFGTINVCANDGTNCRALYNVYATETSAIVLHPQKRKIFWANRGGLSMIVSASMDGTSAKPIAVKSIYLPNAVALDFSNDRLYWSDSLGQVNAISSCNFDGTDRQTLLDGYSGAFAVTVQRDRIYFSKTHVNKIVSIDKNTGNDEEPIIADKVYRMNFPQDN